MIAAFADDVRIRGQLALAGCGIAFLSLGGATLSFALTHAEPGTPLSLTRGQVVWGRLLYDKHGRDVGAAIATAKRIAAGKDRGRMFTGIGWAMESSLERWDLPDLWSSLEQVPAGARKKAEEMGA